MKYQVLLSLILISLFSQPLLAQNPIPPATVKNIEKVFSFAKRGYDERNAWNLVKAANILINHPEIQDLSKNKVEKDSLGENELYKDFFNPQLMLIDADKIAPIDAKTLHFAIKQSQKRIPDWVMMKAKLKEEGGIIQVKNYMIASKNSKTIKTDFDYNKKVTLSVRVGNDLRLSVFDTAKRKKVGNSKFIGDARMLSFITESDGEHQIKIENVSNQSNDCLLMIETR